MTASISMTRCSQLFSCKNRILSSPEYFAKADEAGGFLLKHGVGSHPSKSEIDHSLNYGDYYYIEALLRLQATK